MSIAAVAPSSRLDALPDEIKTLIARQCQLQDEEWRQRKGAMVHAPPPSGQLTWSRFVRTVPESSIRSLFAVSRGWSRLVAPMAYEVLDARTSGPISEHVFRFNILRRRGEHVKVVIAPYSEEVADWEDLMRCLPGLPNIKELHSSCWDEHFLEGPETGEQNSNHASTLARYHELQLAVVDLLRSVKTLVMKGRDARDVLAHLITACPPPHVFAAERLDLVTESASDLGDLPRVARLMPNLRTLDVRVDILDQDLVMPSVSFDTLRHLFIRVCNHAHASSLLRLGHINNATLETLSLTTTAYSGEGDVPSFPPFVTTYPRLRRLTIDPWKKATLEGGRALLDSITSERPPKLEVLAVREAQAFAAESDLGPAWEQLLTRPGFRLCEPVVKTTRTYDLVAYESGSAAVERVRRRDPTVSQDFCDEILARHAARDAISFARDGKLRRQLDDAAKFFADSLAAASERNDVVALSRLAHAAKGLVTEQMFMET